MTIRILGNQLAINRRSVVLARLRCPATEASPPCAGRLVLRTARRVPFRGQRQRVLLGRARFQIGAGQTSRVRIRLGRQQARLVRRNPAARRVRAIASVRDQAGNSARVVKAMRLRVR